MIQKEQENQYLQCSLPVLHKEKSKVSAQYAFVWTVSIIVNAIFAFALLIYANTELSAAAIFVLNFFHFGYSYEVLSSMSEDIKRINIAIREKLKSEKPDDNSETKE